MTTQHGQYPAACAVNKTKLIVCGGYNLAGSPLSSCEMLDLTNVLAGWRSIAEMLSVRGETSGILLPDNKTFLVTGGVNASRLLSCEKLDIVSNTWSSAGNLLGSRDGHASVFFNNSVVVLGGANVGNSLNTCKQFNSTSNAWSIFPSFSTARYYFGAAVVLNKIYIAGGFSASLSTQALSSVEVFNGTSWSSLPSSLSIARESAEAVAFQNKFAVMGGNRTVIEVYDPITSTWNTTFIPAMKIYPLRRSFAAVSF
jgi:hypothetical protein